MSDGSPDDRTWRPLGFFLLMIGFGLRLDTTWQTLAGLLLVAGGACTVFGLWRLAVRRGLAGAFVPPPGGQ